MAETFAVCASRHAQIGPIYTPGLVITGDPSTGQIDSALVAAAVSNCAYSCLADHACPGRVLKGQAAAGEGDAARGSAQGCSVVGWVCFARADSQRPGRPGPDRPIPG